LRISLPYPYGSRALPPVAAFPTRRSSDLVPEDLAERAPVELGVLVSLREMPGAYAGAESREALVGHGIELAMGRRPALGFGAASDRKSTRLNSSHVKISYAVFCLKKKKT